MKSQTAPACTSFSVSSPALRSSTSSVKLRASPGFVAGGWSAATRLRMADASFPLRHIWPVPALNCLNEFLIVVGRPLIVSPMLNSPSTKASGGIGCLATAAAGAAASATRKIVEARAMSRICDDRQLCVALLVELARSPGERRRGCCEAMARGEERGWMFNRTTRVFFHVLRCVRPARARVALRSRARSFFPHVHRPHSFFQHFSLSTKLIFSRCVWNAECCDEARARSFGG